jgi:hypothetical protein
MNNLVIHKIKKVILKYHNNKPLKIILERISTNVDRKILVFS